MSTAPWPRSLAAFVPRIAASCGHRVPLREAFVMADEQTTYCRSCLLLVACSDAVRTAVQAPRRLPALRPVETVEDDEHELQRSIDQLRHVSQHEQFPMYGCHWCLASGRFFR